MPFCPFLSVPSFAFTTVSSMIVRGTRPDARASILRWHLPNLVVDTRQSAWHPQPTGAWTAVWCSPHGSGLGARRAADPYGAQSGNIDCARSHRDTYYRFHETGIVHTAAGGHSLSTQTRTKDALSSITASPMVFGLPIAASRTWRRLKSTNRLPKVIAVVGSTAALRSCTYRQNTPPDHLVT